MESLIPETIVLLFFVSDANEAPQRAIAVLRSNIRPKSEYYSQNGQDWYPLDKTKSTKHDKHLTGQLA